MDPLKSALDIADRRFRDCGRDAHALPPTLRAVHLIGQLDFEMNLGGTQGWLTNSSGKYALDTVEALELVGAHQCAAIIRKILAFFPDGLADDDVERARQIETVLPTAHREWRELETELLAWPDDIHELLCRYVAKHEDDFK